MAKLASLVVDLQLQSAQLRQGLDEANRKLEDFAKQSERTANVLEGVFTFEVLKEGLTALTTFITDGATAVTVMSNLAKAAGTPVEEFSQLSYAAERFGFESDNLSESFAQLAEYMAEAKKGSAEHAALFRGLGISVTDAGGKLRSTGDVFKDLAQRFSEMQDGTAKTALAVKFFGEEGIKLIPTLNQGKAGLAALGDEAVRMGAVLTEVGAAKTAHFTAALGRLQKAGEGLASRVAQDLAPNLSALADNLTNTAAGAEAFDTVASVLATTMRALATATVMVTGSFEVMGKAAAYAAAWTSTLFEDEAEAARSADALAAAGKSVSDALAAEGRNIRAIWDTSGPGATMAADATKAKPAADEYLAAIERTKKATEEAAASQKKAAERAAAAQKKLAEAAKKAAEESVRALEESVKAALALERQHEAIDRAAEARLSDGAATDGFSDIGDAAARMVAAQKAAATMRARASERERGGDILGADSAVRRADELNALAERASAAVDAFRNMGKEAEEAAARLLDEQIASVAALEQSFDAIEREVASRRAAFANPDADPTAGFADFNSALDAMAEAMRQEATLRAEASALERAGKLGEARQARLAADATGALAQTASLAADALAEMDRARANVPGELGGMLTGVGSATSATLQGVETGAAAGPVGAVVGGLVGLLSQSETFQGALSGLEEIFQALADSVGKLIEPLMPLLTVVGEVAGGLGALFEALSPIVEFVARPLFEIFKRFGLIVLGLVQFVGDIINGIAEFLGLEGFDLSGIAEARERLEASSYDAARAQEEVAETVREAAGGLNTVSWWKDSMARFGAVENGRVGGGGGGGTNVVNDYSQTSIEVNGVTDPEAVYDEIVRHGGAKGNRRHGNQADTGGQWIP